MSRRGGNLPEGGHGGSQIVDALRDRTFAVLYVAEVQSLVGDQIARVALAILVYDRTGSAAATSLTYACTFLPALAGGAWLARLGDLYSRRAVMVCCDLARAGLFALMALGGLALPVLFALLVVAIFIGPAFAAAEVSTLALVLDPRRFRAATGLRMMTGQLAQVGGFVLGGAIVAGIAPHGALLVNAVSYVISAVLVAALVGRTGVSGPADAKPSAGVGGAAWTWLWHRPTVRSMMLLGWLAAFFVVPEGLAVPFAARHGASSTQVGLLLAAIPLGGAIGALLVVRWVPPALRGRVARWMAVLAGVPLLVTAVNPGIALTAVLWAVSGLFAAYQVEMLSLLVHLVPDDRRASVLGLVAAGLTGAQGIGLIVFGLLAQAIGAASAVAVAGALGSVLAAIVGTRGSLGALDSLEPLPVLPSVVILPAPVTSVPPWSSVRPPLPPPAAPGSTASFGVHAIIRAWMGMVDVGP